jgi:mRNA-degrading endonuclease toxin of MazEF toxin-antitoxin module
LICAVTSSLRTHEYASRLTTGDLEQGVLKVESKVPADTITSIDQSTVLKQIGRVTRTEYEQVISLIQKLISIT